MFGIERLRAGQEHVAVDEVKGPGVAMMRIMVGHRADDSRVHFHFEDVAEGLFDEQDSFAVGGPVRTFPEPGQPPDVRGKVVGGVVRVGSC